MINRFSRGSVARLYLDLVVAGVGAVAQSPTIAVRRMSDGFWFNLTGRLFQAGFVANPMTELDAVNLPGAYVFDFNHAKDLLVTSSFLVKKLNAGVPVALEYEDIEFGPLPSVNAPSMCSIQGTIIGPDGKPKQNEIIEATLIPVQKDSLGRGYEADTLLQTYTLIDGSFDLPVVRGSTIRLRIAAIGYDRKALVPDQSSILFTAL